MTVTESALALHLQEGHATDPAIATLLVQHFAPGVQGFTLSLLNGHPDAAETARAITRQTFAQALNDPESFMGKEDIRAWLYARALRQTRALPTAHQARPHLTLTGEPLPGLASLAAQESLPLLLRYGHRLPLPEIASLLHTPEAKIHKRLTRARQILIEQIGTANQQTNQPAHPTRTTPPLLFSPAPLPPSHFPHETQRLLDHLLDPEAEAKFRDHLETCDACRVHLKQYAELEVHLNTLLHHDPPLPTEQIQDIVKAVVTQDITPLTPTWQVPRFTRLPLREIGLIFAAAVVFLILARWLNPFFSSPPASRTPPPAPTATLPLAMDLSTVFRQTDPNALTANPFPGQHLAWNLSEVRTGDHIPTTPILFSPFSQYAAFGDGAQVILWQLDDTQPQTIFEGHEAVITALEFFPQEDLLITGDESGNVLIWDLLNGRVRFRLEEHPGPIRHLAVAQNSRYVAVALDAGVWIWEMKDRTVQLIQKYRWDGVRLVTFSPDGTYLTAADRENTIIIWRFPAGTFLLRYETLENNNPDRLTRLMYAPDGKTLATGSLDGRVELVTLSPNAEGLQGTRLFVLPHPAWISDIQWSPDGQMLAVVAVNESDGVSDSSGRAIYLWEVETGALVVAPLTAQITEALFQAKFSPTGDAIWATNHLGDLFQWTREDLSHLVAAVPVPQFFTRTESNLYSGLLPEYTLPIQFSDPALTSFNFVPFTLFPLPARYTFLNGDYSVRDSVIALHYQAASGNPLTLTERLLTTDEIPPVGRMIGASAVVQPVQIHGTMGEYVTGSWALTYPDNPNGAGENGGNPVYRWQATGEARLRWIQNNLLMEIRAPLFQLNENNLTRDNLVNLAENLTAQTEPALVFSYVIQDGDTCFDLAFRFGSTVERLAAVNQLTNCDLIVAGQTMLVPLPTARETIAEVDMNCDLIPERVRAIPDPNLADLSANFGVVVETIPPGGDQFWPVWDLTIADLAVVFFGEPILYTGGACEIFLGVSTFGGPSESSGLDLYRWNGTSMERVLDANGYVLETNSPNGTTPFRITTQSLVRDPAAGGCTRTTTTYEWDGAAFVPIEEIRDAGVDCLDG